MLMQSNYKSSKSYYYYLAKAGSYWGKKVYEDIYRFNDLNNKKLDVGKEISLISA